MTRRRLLIAFLLAAVGYGGLALLFPRYDSSNQWRMQLGRSDAILRGRSIALSSGGIDVTEWPVTVTTHTDDGMLRYLKEPGRVVPDYVSPVGSFLIFRKPGSDDNVVVALTASGKPSTLLIHVANPAKTASPLTTATEAEAGAAIGRVLGVPPFGTLSSVKHGPDGTRFQWTGTPPHSPELTVTTDCLIQGGRLLEMRVASAIEQERRAQLRPPAASLNAARVTVRILLQFLVIILAIIATVKKRYPIRSLFVFVAVVFAVTLIGGIASPEFGEAQLDKPENFFRTLFLLDFFLAFGLSLFAGSAWAAGHSASRRHFATSTARFDALLRGRLFSPPVAGSIATGLLCGGVVASLPYWFAAAHLTAGLPVAGTGGSTLFDPSYTALMVPLDWVAALLVYAFTVPVLSDWIRNRAASWITAALIGAVVLPNAARIWPLPSSIALSIVMFVAFDQLLRRVDLVAVLTAATASVAVTLAGSYLMQPAPSVRASGTTIVLGLAIACAAFLARSLMSGSVEAEPEESWSSLEGSAVGERERLLVEISVAREAQQRMLPLAPPAIPGFSVASICRPAQRVGGDLYDFVALEEGRWGIAVADVSGKGLPAAMYMSMTKGLLLAAADERSDALEIMADVNAGLYSVGQRNVFVTMFFAVLDPTSREVAFVRAGHNAALWRKPGTRETVSLTPSGIALGMSGSKLFTRSCAVERLTMAPGDTLFIYSDGVTEAMNGKSEEYGDDRLAAAIARSDGLDAAAARDRIIDDVSAFVGKTSPNDDLTLVVLQAADEGLSQP
jgi:hypothetical protein